VKIRQSSQFHSHEWSERRELVCVTNRSGTMATAPALMSPSIERQGKALPVFRKFGTQRSFIRPNACALGALANTNATAARMDTVNFAEGLAMTTVVLRSARSHSRPVRRDRAQLNFFINFISCSHFQPNCIPSQIFLRTVVLDRTGALDPLPLEPVLHHKQAEFLKLSNGPGYCLTQSAVMHQCPAVSLVTAGSSDIGLPATLRTSPSRCLRSNGE
jgi:hypothetical protein